MTRIWRPPQEDAVDVVIDRILDPNTVEPVEGFSDNEFDKLQNEQTKFLNSEWWTTKADMEQIDEKVRNVLEAARESR